MASLSNINGIFDVHSTGAILFSTSHGTSGQILKSNGNAAPTWVDASTVIGGPYLPLSGGTLTGATATASGISFTVGGVLNGTSATFSGSVGIGTNSPDYLLDLYKSTGTTSSATGTTLQRLWNYVGSDLNQQKTFIDFVFQDDNDNEYPQVRIGAEVGQNGNANTQEKEGSGAFVVYTNNATGVGPGTPTGLAERFRVDYTGNVGINKANPSYKLDVEGDVRLGGTEAQNYPIKMGRDNNAVYLGGPNINTINVAWDTDADYNMHLNYVGYAGGVTQFRNLVINDGKQGHIATFKGSTGNVGIGTDLPFSKLTVSRPGINEGTISFDDQANNAHLTLAGTDSLVRLQLGTYNNGNYGGWIQASYDNGGVNYGTEPLILNPQGGNVGIGTTSPGEKLEVNGNIKGGYGIFNAESLTEDLRVGGIYGNLGLYIADAYDMQFSIGSTNSKWKFTLANIDKFVITPNGDTTANGSMVWGNGTGRIISNQLQSGYNTASDNLDFWLNYTGYQGGASYFRDTRIGNGKTGLIAKFEGSTGNVGIGTDSPLVKTHIYESGDIVDTGNENSYAVRIAQTNTLKSLNLGYSDTYNAGVISAVHQGVAWKDILINPVGGRNVAIGTTSPNAKLHVAGKTLIGASATRSTDGLTVGYSNSSTFSVNSDATDGNRTISVINEANDITNTYATVSFRISPTTSTSMGDFKFVRTAPDENSLIWTAKHGTNFYDRFTIKSDGNVGIGTTSPSGPFHVKVGTSTPLIVASSSYCNNVGIRTTTPTASLQVKGNVSYSYNNYTNVATTWVNVFNMASYPTGLYQVSIIKKTNASAYITAIIKWDATASASTAGTIVNTITSNQLGVSFNGSTTLQSISALATGTLMSANLQCLVTNEDFCS